ncbi:MULTISPECIES: hypothetical protein [Acidiplasma]|jgi:uncharacterized protein YpuA (DUF1002 family)|uniref:Uncharacterized protein n=2 Tax=Acidiplasma TaxID=507753 RepID=A0A0Q0VXZ3_9ARCH|nr:MULTISPECIES: hypothetical protein [Acidiplasma]KJE49115.1 hypothetical protein TZ01_03205 [Acidiplasma sp. MBA-1]KPV46654.1 hypothetical protein SE19_04560 [Acidiplasma aeolicum]KQB36343.1 hypothetical protein AOG54_02150 [Acidiplasma aeolicum]KQB36623.1 hypothetical protein AOG55_03500 [Acidiplasma cupricumulans]WMT54951.1 MAG: hypothetical protein RE470_08560 [Acidiplasma sp.]
MEDIKSIEEQMEKTLEDYRSKIESIVNSEYEKLNTKTLNNQDDENVSGALTMMESINIDILHILRDLDDLIYYLNEIKKL